jgi:pyrroline-5-carboxylate reductase
MMATTAILGTGVMGEALLSGLLRAGWAPTDVVVTDRRVERCAEIEAKYGVKSASNAQAVAAADTVVIVVKPQDMASLLAEVRSSVAPGTLVISLAAGITTSFIEAQLPEGVPVVRVMPNTPALVDQGMAAISAGLNCSDAHLDQADKMLASTGRVVRVPEKYQDAVTAISGSGPAYIFYVVEAMIEAGVLLGLPRAIATELTVQTALGAATMLSETGEHPTVLRERVTSPAGTTVAALRKLDDHKVRAAFLSAMEAARDRSAELAEG